MSFQTTFNLINLSSAWKKGSIKFDDEDDNNANTKTGRLPMGVFDENTELNFCCRYLSDHPENFHLNVKEMPKT